MANDLLYVVIGALASILGLRLERVLASRINNSALRFLVALLITVAIVAVVASGLKLFDL